MKSKLSYYWFMMVTIFKSIRSKNPDKTFKDEVAKLSDEDLVQYTLHTMNHI